MSLLISRKGLHHDRKTDKESPMTKRSSGFFISLALALISLPAAAIEVQSSVSVYVTFRDCQPLVGQCDGFSPVLVGTYSGEPGALSAIASQALPEYGESYSTVSLSGEIGAPILRTRAASETGKRVSTNTHALQRYVYEGAVPTERTFGGTLTYSQVIENPEDDESGVNAAIFLFRSTSEFLDAGTTSQDNYQMLSTLQSRLFSETLAFDGARDKATNLNGYAALAATVMLQPGDAVWVYTRLQTPASAGSVVDASSTLITQWDDPTGIVPANISPGIPEELMARLLDSATGVGPGTSLADKVAIAQAYYAAQDVESACATLEDFQKQVNAVAGRRLSRELANQLSSDAQQTQLAIGCF
jgi:hypothetical protein